MLPLRSGVVPSDRQVTTKSARCLRIAPLSYFVHVQLSPSVVDDVHACHTSCFGATHRRVAVERISKGNHRSQRHGRPRGGKGERLIAPLSGNEKAHHRPSNRVLLVL